MRRTTEEYARLLIPFHVHREKFVALVEALVSVYVAVNDAAMDLPRAFDIDVAVGVQLDIVGQWVGRTRFIPYPLDTFWFTFNDAQRGFNLGVWKGPYEADYGLYRLADEDYRKLLYAKIGVNHWDGTLEQVESVLRGLYEGNGLSPGSLFFLDDKGDSTAVFAVAQKIPPPLIIAMLAWPAIDFDVSGNRLRTVVTSVNQTPLFGFDVQNNWVSGFNGGAWGVPPETYLNS